MAQSLSRIIVHIIFSTKDRFPFLDTGIRPEMHAYLATACRSADCHAFRVGGVADHVHIACALSRTIAVSKLVEVIKKDSSKWIKEKGASYQKYAWQSGYGAFSVSPSHLDEVVRYINNQEEHHRVSSFQDEYLKFLKKYDVEYDERYLWD